MSTAETKSGARRPRMGLVWVLIALATFGAVLYVALRTDRPAETPARAARGGAGAPPMPVGTATVQTGDMPIRLNALGTVTPLATVTVRPQIAGQLVKLGFQEGQEVEKGDFLAQIDPRPYQLQLEQAEAQLARDQALLKNAQVDLARYRTLVAEDSIARQQLDTQESLVRQYEGTIKADQAAVGTAKLNLVYCHITAPVTGRVGLRQVDIGNYVQTSDANGIVVITQMKPISVLFTLPEDQVRAVRERLHAGATLPVAAFDRSGRTKLAEGTLATVDNQVDVSTGTVKLRAEFANSDEVLFPNQFVNAVLLLDTLRDAVVAPTAAVQRGSQGTYVYIVKPDHTVAARPVTLGPGEGERVVVADGLAPGDLVVTDGADKLREGARVSLPNRRPAEAGAGAARPGRASSPVPGAGQTGRAASPVPAAVP